MSLSNELPLFLGYLQQEEKKSQ